MVFRINMFFSKIVRLSEAEHKKERPEIKSRVSYQVKTLTKILNYVIF